MNLAVGVDIGGTFTKVGLVDIEGNVFGESHFDTTDKDFQTYLDVLEGEIEKLKSGIDGSYTIEGIGIGAPNANNFRGSIEYAANLEWKGVIPFNEELGKRYDLPITITNDANAAAIGERIYGHAKDLKEFIVITLGTGLGSGIVTNGKLVYGYDAQAGELGHVNVIEGGRLCGCGKRGCLETYASATGIRRNVLHLLADANDDKSELASYSFDKLNGEVIARAAENGDTIAKEAFEMTGRILGRKLADFAAVCHPQVIFLLGGLAKAGDWIFEPTRRHMNENLLPFYRNKIDLQPSGLIDKNAAILGAAALVWDK